MLNHILVPLDGSPLAECVLPHVLAIAKAFNAQIILVHVLEQPALSDKLPKVDPLDWYLKKSAANVYLGTVQTRLQEHYSSVKSVLLEGNVIEKIVEFAQSMPSALLILCGYGETRVNGGGVSNIVQHILQLVRTSTLIVRSIQPPAPFTSDLEYKKVLVALDGSQRAGCVLNTATALAKTYQPELLLVHVVTKPEMARHMPLSQEDADLINRVIERNQEEGSKYLEQTQTRFANKTQTRLLVSDNVATTLQSVTEQEQIDLMILSAHGYSGEAKWPYGSITNRFITDGTTPLLIVQDLQWESAALEPSIVETRQPLRLSNDG
ncbi:MAG: universal stress protein [bacterium]|nr:universal stress protein [bacterium]